MNAIEYSGAEPSLAAALPAVARRIFTATFGHLYDQSDFEAFCDAAFGKDGRMEQALTDAANLWRIAHLGGEPVGYAKLRPLDTPAPAPLPGAMELQQIYVLSEWHGKGVAETLMRWAVATATELGAPELDLTVFDHNARAKAFYTRHGFVDVGSCTFTLGSRTEEDRVWRRPLGARAE
jgi:ribosomal protein S18 acetylase RimI-like enzyme